MVWDVAIIGAGLAGITCAQQLHQAGYKVVVLEKSRGVGGRMATRRLQETLVDHGVPYLEPQGKFLSQLIESLCDRGILEVWTDTIYKFNSPSLIPDARYPRYIAPTGITAVAKFLATGLEIWLNRLVETITPTPEKIWHLTLNSIDDTNNYLMAKAVVVAIPAPQALILLDPLTQIGLSSLFLDNLRSVKFNPCFSVIAGYSTQRQQDLAQLNLSWKSLSFPQHPDLAWIGLDSSKRPDPTSPIFVLHSTADFAQNYLDATDLNPAGELLLSHAAQLLIPWLNSPDWFQVHRWRYAFPQTPLTQDCLTTTTPLPLVCCGDWCGGNLLASAINSGLAAAIAINQQLQARTLPGNIYQDIIEA